MNELTLLEKLGELLIPIFEPLIEAAVVRIASRWMSKRAVDPDFRAKSSQVFAQWADAGSPTATDEDRKNAALALRNLTALARGRVLDSSNPAVHP